MTNQELFKKLFECKNEDDIDSVILKYSQFFQNGNWYPYGGNENNFGVIENQQSSPVAALVEKLTNAIDAILMRRCYEAGIDPKSSQSPTSIEDGIEQFFPDHKNWDLRGQRRAQAENIQILADSKPRDTKDTSLIIYDNGEGQHPEHFEATFLSLLEGNKNEIHFVQGQYNMGGSGAIIFCGKKRYQLIASKRYDGSGLFGFTLIRQHPLTDEEQRTKKNTWYEYLKIGGEIPAFSIDTLDLGLHNRQFSTGTILKLYSYELKGNRLISRDLHRSLNEFLYAPALPILLVENQSRYPRDTGLTNVAHGLKQRLADNDYIETTFSELYQDPVIGKMKVSIHVFKTRAKDKKSKETKETIRDEFFKNRMVVQFSLNGQVHGRYTSEFITRALQFPLLRDYLLIHVDCTQMNYGFRKELFMASRDRLKQGDESSYLRKFLASNLKKGRLKEIYKQRKDSISVEGAESGTDLLKSFAENLPISGELQNLLSKTFKLDDKTKAKKKKRPSQSKKKPEKAPFKPQRFPSFFKISVDESNGRKVIAVPLNGSKTIRFDTDVEDSYFDRADDAGDMEVALLGRSREPNTTDGGDDSGNKTKIEDLLRISRQSPKDGTIKVVMEPTKDVQVGDEIEVRADLKNFTGDFSEVFFLKIVEPESKHTEPVNKPREDDEKLGLPQMIQVFESSDDSKAMTWDRLEERGIEMDYGIVMYPLLEGDKLDSIYINMGSKVLKDYIGKRRKISEEQVELARHRYISAIYFHTLFLYVINRKRNYRIWQEKDDGEENDVALGDYLKEVFDSYYADFLLNFGTNELMDALG